MRTPPRHLLARITGWVGRAARPVCDGLLAPSEGLLPESILWTNLRNQIYLGGDEFVAGVQKKIDREVDLTEVPRAQYHSKANSVGYYQSRHADPAKAMACAYSTGDYTMKEIANHFGVHYATVSRAVKKAEDSGAG